VIGRVGLSTWLAAVAALGVDSRRIPDTVAPCVPCHHGARSDQVGEWLASPYSEPEGGRGCSDCHGPACDARGAGGAPPDGPSSSPSEAGRVSVSAVCSRYAVEVEVAIFNVAAGHSYPTGPAARSLVLEVDARDRDRPPLPLRAGARRRHVPRLAPFAIDVSRSRFGAARDGRARVFVRLVLVEAGVPPSDIAEVETLCTRGTPTPTRARPRWQSSGAPGSPA
jgi:hypothetical protein